MLARMNVDPARQLLVGQCSGALIMSALGLFSGEPVCTDLVTEPLLTRQGLCVPDQIERRRAQRAPERADTPFSRRLLLEAGYPFVMSWLTARSIVPSRLGLRRSNR